MNIESKDKERTSVLLMGEDKKAIKVINQHIGGTGNSHAIRYALRWAARQITKEKQQINGEKKNT